MGTFLKNIEWKTVFIYSIVMEWAFNLIIEIGWFTYGAQIEGA